MNARTGAVALLGFPKTGKSTFLGALWQYMQDEGNATLRETNTAGDRAYLQQLGEAVAQFTTVARTELDTQGGMHLSVEFSDIGEVQLAIPDVAGEALSMLVENRAWPQDLLANVQNASSFLFFVHPSEIINPVRMAETLFLGSGEESPDDSGVPIPEFAVRKACTSATIIDVLENVLACSHARHIRIALVVSAWDLVETASTPTIWAQRDIPAVVNFLRFHERIEFNIFGVSAQGGALPEKLDELLALGSVSDRAYAVDGQGLKGPISAPIAWAVGP